MHEGIGRLFLSGWNARLIPSWPAGASLGNGGHKIRPLLHPRF